MRLTDRLTRLPLPDDPGRGSDAADHVPVPAARDLLRGVAGSAPYLAGLIEREAEWLSAALSEDFDKVVPRVLSDIGQPTQGDLPSVLRQAKRRVALWTALCDLGGAWDVAQVTDALTRLADSALQTAIDTLAPPLQERGKLPAGEGAGGFIVLAMGKHGAFELNYSSDIDLICLYDDTRLDDPATWRPGFVRLTRQVMATLSDLTGEGYVFRTDLRLRPDASVIVPEIMTGSVSPSSAKA